MEKRSSKWHRRSSSASVVRSTFLYMSSGAIIPPHQTRRRPAKAWNKEFPLEFDALDNYF